MFIFNDCLQAYFGGEAECEAAGEEVEVRREELICPDCSETGNTQVLDLTKQHFVKQ